MPNGPNGNRLLYVVAGSLAVLGIAGGVTLAIGQGKLEERQAATEKTQDENAPVIRQYPVVANEIQHIKESIDDIEETQDEILDAIRALER